MGIQAKEGPHGKAQECERALSVTSGLWSIVETRIQKASHITLMSLDLTLLALGNEEMILIREKYNGDFIINR